MPMIAEQKWTEVSTPRDVSTPREGETTVSPHTVAARGGYSTPRAAFSSNPIASMMNARACA